MAAADVMGLVIVCLLDLTFLFSGKCLFYGPVDKFTWLLGNQIQPQGILDDYRIYISGPILVMLLINTYMFGKRKISFGAKIIFLL